MAVYNLAEELYRTPAPAPLMIEYAWPRGERKSLAEAVDLLISMGQVPPGDRAAAEGVLRALWHDGKLIFESNDQILRPDEDAEVARPADDAGSTNFVAFPKVGTRQVLVETVDGETVEIEVKYSFPRYEGDRDGYAAFAAEHRRKPFNPQDLNT